MLIDSEAPAVALERLSALVDGELDGSSAAQACAQWRESAASRSSWHAYHLIGDVLRSDDLACDPARDAGFLEAFRARLASEPVVLAPMPLASAPVAGRQHRRWLLPSAIAAGFVVVAGVLVLTNAPADRSAGPALARVGAGVPTADAVPTAVVATGAGPTVAEPQSFVANGQLIRDARLDRYLAAHKQFAGSSALGVPSSFLRNATANAADR